MAVTSVLAIMDWIAGLRACRRDCCRISRPTPARQAPASAAFSQPRQLGGGNNSGNDPGGIGNRSKVAPSTSRTGRQARNTFCRARVAWRNCNNRPDSFFQKVPHRPAAYFNAEHGIALSAQLDGGSHFAKASQIEFQGLGAADEVGRARRGSGVFRNGRFSQRAECALDGCNLKRMDERRKLDTVDGPDRNCRFLGIRGDVGQYQPADHAR